MTFYVRYIVEPEYTTVDDPEGLDCVGGNKSWKCNSTMVLGAVVVVLLVCAALGTPIWLQIAKRLGKRRTWLLWSCFMAFTNILFYFVGKGDVTKALILGGINGLPMGAKFLADAILSDIIDYDEFRT